MAPNNKDEDNLTAILYKVDDIRLEQTPVPVPGEDQVLVRMDSVGICGSDVHYWTSGAIGNFVVREPMVLGHEAAGIVEKCGGNVTSLVPGDRVAIEPGVPCRRCDFCRSGSYNLCPGMRFCATPPVDGNLRRFYAVDADFCFRLPGTVSLEEGALVEPLSVAVHACRRAGVELGKTVLVCGSGPIGLVNLLTAKAMGAAEVVVTDISEERLKMAKDLGASAVYRVGRGSTPEAVAAAVAGLFDRGRQPDATIECSGAESSVATAMFATRSGGTVVLVGVGPDTISVPVMNATLREVDIRGVFRYANCYPAAIKLIAGGKVNLKPLITHRFRLEETLAAFEMAKSGKAVKVMIKCAKQQ